MMRSVIVSLVTAWHRCISLLKGKPVLFPYRLEYGCVALGFSHPFQSLGLLEKEGLDL